MGNPALMGKAADGIERLFANEVGLVWDEYAHAVASQDWYADRK